jgi:alanine racemase
MDGADCSTWVEIDLSAIRENVARLIQLSRSPVMAVVKANGYGHGLVEAAAAAVSGGASWCGVARIEEGLALRHAGIQTPILVTGYTSPGRVHEAVQGKISLTLYDMDIAAACSNAALNAGSQLRVHAKVDTSMGRLGVFPEEGAAFLQFLSSQPGLFVEGIFTHFASADEPSNPVTAKSLTVFRNLLVELQSRKLRPPLAHAANSAATLYFPSSHFDLVRCGISIYGLHPSGDAPLPEGFRQALCWKTRLVSVKNLPPGHGVGYNARYVTSRQERIGVISVGYADGFRRRLGNFALLRGQRVPVVGGVCMDQCMLQLDAVQNAQVGDEVVLLGWQGDQVLTAEEVASAWGTVNYEIVCGLAARIPRFYRN